MEHKLGASELALRPGYKFNPETGQDGKEIGCFFAERFSLLDGARSPDQPRTRRTALLKKPPASLHPRHPSTALPGSGLTSPGLHFRWSLCCHACLLLKAAPRNCTKQPGPLCCRRHSPVGRLGIQLVEDHDDVAQVPHPKQRWHLCDLLPDQRPVHICHTVRLPSTKTVSTASVTSRGQVVARNRQQVVRLLPLVLFLCLHDVSGCLPEVP